MYWLTICATPAQSPPPQGAPEIASHQAPAIFTSRVNLVSVPVVVRDSTGRAVGNLRQEDFRLFDNGQRQIVTKFSVNRRSGYGTAPTGLLGEERVPERSPSPDGPLPNRFVAYIFDDIHMDFEDLSRMRAAAERHFAESFGPNTRVAIATTSGRVWLDFTSDRDKLHEALLQIAPGPNAIPRSNNVELGQRDACPPNVSFYRADQALNFQNPQEIQAAEAAAVACYGQDPNPPALGLAVSATVLSAGNTDTKNTFTSLANLVHRLSATPGSRTIVLVSSGFFVTRDFYQTETAFMDSAIRANVTLNGLDARGLYAATSGEANAQADAMRRMADGTGGKYYHDKGFKEAFDQTANPPEFTYILGFSPQNLKFDGGFHRLKVALGNAKGLELQARRGYWAPNHAEDAAEQAKQEIQEVVFSLDELRDIPMDVTTQFFKTSDVAAELTVESRLDLNGLKFRTSGDRSDDTLTVVTGLFDQDGHYVKGIQRVIDLRLRSQTMEKLLGSGIPVRETFDVAPGHYMVRVVVRDSQGQAMAARNGTVNIR